MQNLPGTDHPGKLFSCNWLLVEPFSSPLFCVLLSQAGVPFLQHVHPMVCIILSGE